MKKLTWAASKTLIGQIAPITCLTAATAGVVFGVAGATFKIEYMVLNDADARLRAAQTHDYFSQNINNQWNMNQVGTVGEKGYIKGIEQPYSRIIEEEWWKDVHHQGGLGWNEKDPVTGVDPHAMGLSKAEDDESNPLTDAEIAQRKKYAALVIDGATHTALDRSFNQGLYNGIANFIQNKRHTVNDDSEAQIYRPSQDNTQDFLNTYRAVASKTRILSLAGFNHVTPLNALGTRDEDGTYHFTDERMANTGLMLMDGDVANNQNIVSVLFRSDQPAFLTAIATAMYFYNNLHLYHDTYQDLKVGIFGGAPIPTVTVYMGGYQRGVEFFNEYILKRRFLEINASNYMYNDEQQEEGNYFVAKLLPASKYKEEVEAIKALPAGSREKRERCDEVIKNLYDEYSLKLIKLGDFNTHFTGTFISGDGIGITKQFLNRGASAIIVVAGPQSMDAAQEIKSQNSKCIVIGVDSAMETSDYQKPFSKPEFADTTKAIDGSTPKQAGNVLKFSAVKDMTEVSDKILRLAARGEHWTVNNAEPYNTPVQIPPYTENEVLPADEYLQYKAVEGKDDEFEIIGLKKLIPESSSYHVLYLPTSTNSIDGKLRHLTSVGADAASPATFEFNCANLGPIDTLKVGPYVKNKVITFKDRAFNFNLEQAAYPDSGFKYVDFSQNDYIITPDNAKPFLDMGDYKENTRTYHKGVVKFSNNLLNSDKAYTFDRFFKGQTDSWHIIEPDPLKSICSFGFKTCGNIENGLISISWEGWYYLLEGIRNLVLFNIDEPASQVPFMDAWKQEALNYFQDQTRRQEVTPEFINLVVTDKYQNLSTFDYDSVVHQYYSHVMAILGRVFKHWGVDFDPSMTIFVDDQGVPQRATGDGKRMSILDWLKINMYFTI